MAMVVSGHRQHHVFSALIRHCPSPWQSVSITDLVQSDIIVPLPLARHLDLPLMLAYCQLPPQLAYISGASGAELVAMGPGDTT